MTIEKKKEFLINAAFCAVLILAAWLFVTYLLGPLCPFILGFLIAWLLQRPARAIARALHLRSSRIPVFLLTLVLYGIVFVAATAAWVQISSALEHFLPRLPQLYTTSIAPALTGAFDALEAQIQQYDPAVVGIVDRIGEDVFSFMNKLISSVSVAAVRLASGIVTGMPSAILAVIITVVSSFFVGMDFDTLVGFVRSRLPAGLRGALSATAETGMSSVRKLLVAYMLIMFMSFCELSIGFLLLHVPYAVGLALLVSIIDILPILGTGTVLIPWAIIALVLGLFRMAAGVALLYVVMMLVRNVVEPKLVGQQIGLHPLVTLVSMFVGLKLFGFLGMFGVPLALVLYLKLRALRSRVQPG